jgi:hypothetical protein
VKQGADDVEWLGRSDGDLLRWRESRGYEQE